MARPLRMNPANSRNDLMGWGKGREVPGLNGGASANGIRQFWKPIPEHPEQEAFSKALLDQMLNLGSAAKPLLIKNAQLKTPPKGGGPSAKAAHIESWRVETLPSQVRRR